MLYVVLFYYLSLVPKTKGQVLGTVPAAFFKVLLLYSKVISQNSENFFY